MFDRLIISSPNRGATIAIPSNGEALCLECYNATGLSRSGNILARGIQPKGLFIHRLDKEDTTMILGGEGNPVRFDDIHDVLIHEDRIYLVSTGDNSVLVFDLDGKFVRRHTYPGEADSMHINSISILNGVPVFSCFGDFSEARGYKNNTKGRGYVAELLTGERLIEGLSQPHSLYSRAGNLIVANSEEFEMREYSHDFKLTRSTNLGAYTRGIWHRDGILYVGLSSARNDETPEKTCQIAALDLDSWAELSRFRIFGLSEIYAIVGYDHDDEFDFAVKMITDNSKKLPPALVGF